MTTLKKVDALIYKDRGVYLNNFCVLFSKEPGYIFVDAPWPGYKNGVLGLVLLCKDYRVLFEVLAIDDVQQLDQLKPEDLLRLFYEGKAIAVCSVDENDSLDFQINGDRIIVINGKSDWGYEVNEPLVAACDFIEYTRKYFLQTNSSVN